MVTTTTNNHRPASTAATARMAISDKTNKKPSRPSGSKPTSFLDNSPELRNTVAAIEKQFGEGAIMPLGSDTVHVIEGISTGCLSLDLALGGQGVPRGRIIEVFGPESSGKTTLALHVVAQAQKGEGIAAFIDAEQALDPTWAKKLGVQSTQMFVATPTKISVLTSVPRRIESRLVSKKPLRRVFGTTKSPGCGASSSTIA